MRTEVGRTRPRGKSKEKRTDAIKNDTNTAGVGDHVGLRCNNNNKNKNYDYDDEKFHFI